MTRDYKNRRSAPAKAGAPCWLWGLAGLLVGLLVAGLVYLGGPHPGAPLTALVPAAPEPAASAPTPAPAPPAEAPRPKPRFEFYSILPEMEVPVEEPALPARASREPPAAAEPQKRGAGGGQEGAAYLLQVGSFRSLEEADRLKANLTLLGLEPRIQTVTVDGRATWHRVRVGPYPTLGAAYGTRDRLRGEGVEAIVLKVAG
jgi:cell division protein FtsN